MRIGIDLLWVRVGICGGTESYIRNLLDGFAQYADKQEYVLFVARDNAESFRHYEKNACMTFCTCDVASANPARRILWENLHLDRTARKQRVDIMFIPVYSMPLKQGSRIPYVSVIHDLQALHYPEYFSRIKRMFLKYTWWNTCRRADRVITISNFCKNDLIASYPFVRDKITTIYNPIITKASALDSAHLKKYGVEAGSYFYCVSSMLPHKNLKTLLKVMAKWDGEEVLVISGVGGNTAEITECIREYGIEEKVVLTGFVSDEERDCLYENCRLFLFPSIFEGFGMPPIEAMQKGKAVVMTRESCLEEVTRGKAVYVDSPFSVEEWKERIAHAMTLPSNKVVFEDYTLPTAVKHYVEVLRRTADKMQ